MTYRITGLDPVSFSPLFAGDADAIHAAKARFMEAPADFGTPCRVSLRDASRGERVALLHHTSHAADTPYRSAYAIFVRDGAEQATYTDEVPPVFENRPLAMRCFDDEGMLLTASIAMPGLADAVLRQTLASDPAIAYIDVHNAAHGCFAARVERDGDEA